MGAAGAPVPDLAAAPIVTLPYSLSSGAQRRLRVHPERDVVSSSVRMASRMDFWFMIDQVFMRVPERHVMLDVGAHVGLYAVVASDFFANVIAIEPHPANAALLEANVALNGLTNVRVERLALSDRTAEAPLYSAGFDLSVGSLAPTATRDPGPSVRTITGDDLLGPAPPRLSMVKIDTEGHEAHVLRGLARSLAAQRPRPLLQVEFCPSTLRAHGSSADDILATVAPLGYDMHMALGHVIAPVTPEILRALYDAWQGTLALTDLYFVPKT